MTFSARTRSIHDTSYELAINDWEYNKTITKKGLFGFQVRKFQSNYIKTTKYTWWNFIFLNLFHQFKKISNLYFILVLIFTHEFTLARISKYTGVPKLRVNDATSVVLSFLTFFILFNLLIPISLFVTFEFVKMIQAWFITRDNKLAVFGADPHNPERNILVRSTALSSDLNADLAKIDIIFSDKTGTLTENSMIFNKCCVGSSWIHDDITQKGALGNELARMYQELKDKSLESVDVLTCEEELLFSSLNTLLLLALCHDVSPRDLSTSKEEKASVPTYEGASVDEIALVQGAFNNGFQVKFCSDKTTIVSILGKDYTFERVSEIPFTPERKRMSVLFEISEEFLTDFPVYRKMYHKMLKATNQSSSSSTTLNGGECEKVLVCFTKGADSFLFPCIEALNSEQHKTKLDEHILNFAKQGLRTLLLAFKFVDSKHVQDWVLRYNSVKSVTSVNHDTELALETLEKEMEQNLNIVGATAIEDMLQPQVPETIKFFLDAGLQLWMLTGDKRETALNAAFMANFIDENSQIISLNGEDIQKSQESVNKAIEELLLNITSKKVDHISSVVALIIDGHAFSHCMEHETSTKLLVELIKKCKTVICCRATPKQKAQLVEITMRRLQKTGLAIGDGANDVPMILKAKVGIGIMGKEGTQAKLASDYSIPRFYMLKRLLTVHGRYSFKRSAKHIQYSFYKNITLTFIQIYFTFYTMYSGQTLVDSSILSWYNLIFTILNPFVFGLFDKDIHEKHLEDPEIGPKLYSSLKTENIFNVYTFTKWIGSGILHSAVIFFFVMYASHPFGLATGGMEDGLWLRSILVCSCVYCVVNFKCYFEMESFTILHHLAMAISFILYYGFNAIQANTLSRSFVITDTNMYRVWNVGIVSPAFWLTHILCIVTPLSIELALHGLKWMLWPDVYQVVRMNSNSRKKKNQTSQQATKDQMLELSYYRNAELKQLSSTMRLNESETSFTSSQPSQI